MLEMLSHVSLRPTYDVTANFVPRVYLVIFVVRTTDGNKPAKLLLCQMRPLLTSGLEYIGIAIPEYKGGMSLQ